jgi:hypothetical protein
MHAVFVLNTVIFVGLQSNCHFNDRFYNKSLNIRFHENPSSGSRQTDSHDEAIANALKNDRNSFWLVKTVLYKQLIAGFWSQHSKR